MFDTFLPVHNSFKTLPGRGVYFSYQNPFVTNRFLLSWQHWSPHTCFPQCRVLWVRLLESSLLVGSVWLLTIKKLQQPVGNIYSARRLWISTHLGRAEGWVSECISCFKHRNLNLVPESIGKSWRQWWDSCNPSAGETETGYRMLSGVRLARQSRVCKVQVQCEVSPPKNNLESD